LTRATFTKGGPVKKLTEGLTKTGGRNNSGHVTSWQKGGGHKRRYRMVDFKRAKTGMAAIVERIEYDPNRTAFIALITYEDGVQSYILAPQRLAVGDKVMSGVGADIKPGNAMPLGEYSRGNTRPQCRVEAGQGWPDGTLSRHLYPAGRPRSGLCDPAFDFW
jgi:large subunit ribosomal protein L2